MPVGGPDRIRTMVQAFIVGGTGEVGKPLLKELLASSSYSAVVAFARHPINYTGPGKEKLVRAPG